MKKCLLAKNWRRRPLDAAIGPKATTCTSGVCGKNYRVEELVVLYPDLPGDSNRPPHPVPRLQVKIARYSVKIREDGFLLTKEDGKPLDSATFYK
jgi:hypothetical protein